MDCISGEQTTGWDTSLAQKLRFKGKRADKMMKIELDAIL